MNASGVYTWQEALRGCVNTQELAGTHAAARFCFPWWLLLLLLLLVLLLCCCLVLACVWYRRRKDRAEGISHTPRGAKPRGSMKLQEDDLPATELPRASSTLDYAVQADRAVSRKPPAPPSTTVSSHDLPADWEVHERQEDGLPYFFNVATGESRWDHPESTSARRTSVDDQPVRRHDLSQDVDLTVNRRILSTSDLSTEPSENEPSTRSELDVSTRSSGR